MKKGIKFDFKRGKEIASEGIQIYWPEHWDNSWRSIRGEFGELVRYTLVHDYGCSSFSLLKKEIFNRIKTNLEANNISFIDKPYTRFKGTKFEQNTFFIEDPNGNVLELKTFE